MTDDDAPPPPPPRPIWHHMRQMARHAPSRAENDEGLPPREVQEHDVQPLREQGQWSPTTILEKWGPSPNPQGELGRLAVAIGVLQGAHRIGDVAEFLQHELTSAKPRLLRMLEDDALSGRRPLLRTLLKRVNASTRELPGTRARANNEKSSEGTNPDGLLYLDLTILADQIHTLVMTQEISGRRNAAGIDFGLRYAQNPPELEYAERWIEKILGADTLGEILLYWPREYGRVVLVHSDGRLLFDPKNPEGPGD